MACWYPKKDEKKLFDLLLTDKRYWSVKMWVAKKAKSKGCSNLEYIAANMGLVYEKMQQEFESYYCKACLPFIKLIIKIREVSAKIWEKIFAKK